jgi:hypothetical protein
MAIYPNATFMPLPENDTQDRIHPISVIVHTHVGNPSLEGARSFLLDSGQEHHFNLRIGGVELAQYVDTEVRADNNWQANSFQHDGRLCGAISIETGDSFHSGDPGLTSSFTDLDEFDTLADLIAWCCRTHDIPAKVCASPFEPGIGYHSMWGVNERGDGDGTFGRYDVPEEFGGGTARLNNPWTLALGKTCPGPGKIAELTSLLSAVHRRLGNPVAAVDPKDGRVPFTGKIRATVRSRQALAVQRRLVAMGFPPAGGADGEYGEQTAEACRRFQGAHGLPVTGVVDRATWRALGLRHARRQRTTVVLSGEGWIAVARRALNDETRWREIRRLNGGKSRTLHPGDRLLLPAA